MGLSIGEGTVVLWLKEGGRNGMGNVFLIAVAICNGPKIFNISWKVSIECSSANDDDLWCDVRDCEAVGIAVSGKGGGRLEKISVRWVYIGKSREIWRGKYDWAVSTVAEGKGREVGCCTWQGSNQGQFGHFNILLRIFLAF